jgi:hypothetical protein
MSRVFVCWHASPASVAYSVLLAGMLWPMWLPVGGQLSCSISQKGGMLPRWVALAAAVSLRACQHTTHYTAAVYPACLPLNPGHVSGLGSGRVDAVWTIMHELGL